jgi:hypothetical protein
MEYLLKDFHDAFLVYPSCRVSSNRKVNSLLCCLQHLFQSKERLVSLIVSNTVRHREQNGWQVLAYILPYMLSASVCICFQKHCIYEDVVNFMNNNKGMAPDEFNKLIVERFEASRQTIHAE